MRRPREIEKTVRGSFTVEAALCVPSAFLVLYMVMQLFVFLRIQSDMQVAMNRVVRDLSQYGTVYSQLSSMSSEEAEDFVANSVSIPPSEESPVSLIWDIFSEGKSETPNGSAGSRAECRE